jgi:hypothetical protein
MSEADENAQPGRHENPWRWDEERNPYLHNVLKLLKVEDPEATLQNLRRRLKRARQALRFNRDVERFGYEAKDTDLAHAEELVRDPNRLSEVQMLLHRVHEVEPSEFEESVQFFEELDLDPPESLMPLPLNDIGPIARRLPSAGKISMQVGAPEGKAEFASLLKPDPEDEVVLPF